MIIWVFLWLIKWLIKKKHAINGSRVLILGITFKENCPDIRNSRVIDIYEELIQFRLKVEVYDPYADKNQVKAQYGVELLQQLPLHSKDKYQAIILAVAHKEFLDIDFDSLKTADTVIFDTKAVLERTIVDGRL